jgi:hypothetical protein
MSMDSDSCLPTERVCFDLGEISVSASDVQAADMGSCSASLSDEGHHSLLTVDNLSVKSLNSNNSSNDSLADVDATASLTSE